MLKRLQVTVLLLGALAVCPEPATEAGEWKFGIGSGLGSLTLDGEIGFGTPGGGSVLLDLDLDNRDTGDLVESGFGLRGFAANGKWKILWSGGRVTLEDSDSGSVGGTSFSANAEWDRNAAEMLGVYQFAKAGNNAFGALFGARWTEHEWSFGVDIGGAVSTGAVSESWTDGVVGVTHSVPFAGRWSWSNQIDAGFGDSEHAISISTGLGWAASQRWLLGLTLKRYALEFENGSPGDSGYYLYDMDETTVGLGALIVF